jgi:hypothetical protein
LWKVVPVNVHIPRGKIPAVADAPEPAESKGASIRYIHTYLKYAEDTYANASVCTQIFNSNEQHDLLFPSLYFKQEEWRHVPDQFAYNASGVKDFRKLLCGPAGMRLTFHR